MNYFRHITETLRNSITLILLAAYFVLDALNKFFGFLSISSSLIVFFEVIIFSIALAITLSLKTSPKKSVIITTFLILIFLFYRVLIKTLISIDVLSFLEEAPFNLPFIAITGLLLILMIRKISDIKALHLSRFLNLLFFILSFIEIFKLTIPTLQKKINYIQQEHISFQHYELLTKPNIFLIVLDEYAGFTSLNQYFLFKNKDFSDSLKIRNFFVAAAPKSNYNFTMFSSLSLLDMNYAENLTKEELAKEDVYLTAAKALQETNTINFFRTNGYEVVNNTFFKLSPDEPVPSMVVPFEDKLITNKTMFGYLQKTAFNRIPSNSIQNILNSRTANFNRYNDQKIKNLYSIINNKSESPFFIYTHLLMPHNPYLKTKTGEVRSFHIAYMENLLHAKEKYIDYLQYVNNILIDIIDSIQKKSKNSIVIITSDHGNRYIQKERNDADYNNFLAVYKPDLNYTGFSDTTCTVNLFRILLNNQFQQSLPLLPYKSIDMAKDQLTQ